MLLNSAADKDNGLNAFLPWLAFDLIKNVSIFVQTRQFSKILKQNSSITTESCWKYVACWTMKERNKTIVWATESEVMLSSWVFSTDT